MSVISAHIWEKKLSLPHCFLELAELLKPKKQAARLFLPKAYSGLKQQAVLTIFLAFLRPGFVRLSI